MIATLIGKDLRLFFRNPFFAVITLLGLLTFIAAYYLLPGTAQDTLSTALVLPGPQGQGLADYLSQVMESDVLPNENALIESVTRGDYKAGLVLDDKTISDLQQQEKVTVDVYLAPGASRDLYQAVEDIYTVGLNSISFAGGTPGINIDEEIVVLGADVLGIVRPIALRERMLPLFLLLVFSIELMGMANLISDEMEKNTVQALLVSPLSIGQFFTAKVLVGMLLAFTQVMLMVLATGTFMRSPILIVLILAMASMMLTGLAFLIASLARSMLSVLAWSTLILLLLVIPGMGVVFPVMAGDWIRTIPTYYVVDSLHRVLNFEARWTDISGHLLMLALSGVLFLAAGSSLLRRRLR